jgi:hypothetical protein
LRWTKARAWCAKPSLGQGAVPRSGPGRRAAMYADKSYDGWWYKAELARCGITDGIMAGSYRQRPLDAEGHARNRVLAPLRLSGPVGLPK